MNKLSSSDNRRLTAFIRRIPDLTPSQRECLIYFKALYIRHGARALHPSVETIAKRCRISERGARYAVRHLEQRGFLRLVANPNGGKGRARHYAFVELAVLSAAYKGGKNWPGIAPFAAETKGAEIAPDKYTRELVGSFPYPADELLWATGKVDALISSIVEGEME